MLKNRDSEQTVLKLVSYHPIKTFHSDLHRLMRTRQKTILIPVRKVHPYVRPQMRIARCHPRLRSKRTHQGPWPHAFELVQR